MTMPEAAAGERFDELAEKLGAELAALGQPARLVKGGKTYTFVAMAQPAGVGRHGGADYSVIGEIPKARYTYYGPFAGGGEQLEAKDVLWIGGRRFYVEAVADYYMGRTPIYRTGALILTYPDREKEAATE